MHSGDSNDNTIASVTTKQQNFDEFKFQLFSRRKDIDDLIQAIKSRICGLSSSLLKLRINSALVNSNLVSSLKSVIQSGITLHDMDFSFLKTYNYVNLKVFPSIDVSLCRFSHNTNLNISDLCVMSEVFAIRDLVSYSSCTNKVSLKCPLQRAIMVVRHVDTLSRAYRIFSKSINRVDTPELRLDGNELINNNRLQWEMERNLIFLSGLVLRMSGSKLTMMEALSFLTDKDYMGFHQPFVTICVIKLLFPQFFPCNTDKFVKWMRVNLTEFPASNDHELTYGHSSHDNNLLSSYVSPIEAVDKQTVDDIAITIRSILQGLLYIS
jgi:hypothetical protein